jgi:hypothetical protein
MELTAKGRHLPFMTASTRLNDRFHIVLNDDTFIERAYYIWRSIGNIATELKVSTVTVGSDLIVTLPQDCEFVRMLVTSEFADGRNFNGSFGDYSFSPKGRSPEVKPDAGMTSVEANVKASLSNVPGERIAYSTYDGYLKLTSPLMSGTGAVLIYNSILVGEDGLPLLNDLEVEAIAVNLAVIEAEQGLFRKDPSAAQILQYLAPIAERALCAAKADEKISDDGLDALLDKKSTWGRKVFNNRFNFA